jgi:hypothetical protein
LKQMRETALVSEKNKQDRERRLRHPRPHGLRGYRPRHR